MNKFINIFAFDDYRVYLRELIEAQQTREDKLTIAKIADAARVKSPYLSKCLSNNADLSLDQAHLISIFLKLKPEESDFFLLLVDYSKSYTDEYKKFLKNKIKEVQRRNLKTEKVLSLVKLSDEVITSYYLNPLNIIIHMYATLDRIKNIKSIADSLKISESSVQKTVNNLVRMGILKIENGEIISVLNNLHLPSDSPLCIPHQKIMSQYIQSFKDFRGGDHVGYNTMFTFSANNETYVKIKNEFLQCLKKIDQLIDNSPSTQVYQIQFDLFPWQTN